MDIDPKSGFKTTEFWVTLLTISVTTICSLSALFGHEINKDHLMALVPTIAPIAAGVAAFGYSHSRAKVKTAHLNAAVALNTPVPAVVSHGVVNVQTGPTVADE